MSCTVMYQPYAMSYSSCDRSSSEKKIFKFPHAPSPPDSSHSDASTYSSPGPSTGGSIGIGPPPLSLTAPSSSTLSLSSGSSLSSHSLNLSHNSLNAHSLSAHSHSLAHHHHPPAIVSLPATISRRPLTPIPLTPSLSLAASSSSNNNSSANESGGGGGGGISIPSASGSSSSASAAAGSSSSRSSSSNNPSDSHSHHHHSSSHHNHTTTSHSHSSPSSHSHSHGGGGGGSSSHSSSHHTESLSTSHRAHYLSANCVVFVHYNGDASRVVDEHFSRALSAAYSSSSEKSSKSTTPMSTRNFPPSFWNSNYQPSKPLTTYGAASAADFYGTAMDYGPAIPTLAHHHQPDPWHYPLPTHQSYHHRPTDIPYPAMPSTSRFNAAQYGSFLLAGAAASSGAGRFPGMGAPGQCGMKGDTGPWAGGRYHHESLSDLHLADYSAAAAAHYSNMTAGLETTVQDSSKDLYWF